MIKKIISHSSGCVIPFIKTSAAKNTFSLKPKQKAVTNSNMSVKRKAKKYVVTSMI